MSSLTPFTFVDCTETLILRNKENPSQYVTITTSSSRTNRARPRSKKPYIGSNCVLLHRPNEETNKSGKFKFNDEVKAFHKYGWWEGVIMEELAVGKFFVFFQSSKEKNVFGEKLRM
ncbi:hypothetical protein LINPERPRIM_LOCUS35342 [Linum perenne]